MLPAERGCEWGKVAAGRMLQTSTRNHEKGLALHSVCYNLHDLILACDALVQLVRQPHRASQKLLLGTT